MRKLLFVALLLVTPAFAQVLPVTQTTSPIDLNCVLGKRSGPAPLSVHFDCSGTISNNLSNTKLSFTTIEYNFDFGDPNNTPVAGACGTPVVKGEGFWRCGKRHGLDSKNRHFGAGVTAHIYENPGTFQACIDARDGTSTVSKCYTITVDDPDVYFAAPTGQTYCISNTGVFTGCPAGATQLTETVLGNAFSGRLANNTRFLFRGGETWNVTSKVVIATNAHTLDIGTFGTGKVVFNNATASDDTMRLGGYPYVWEDGNSMRDFRMRDVSFTWNTCQPSDTGLNMQPADVDDVLLQRLDSEGFGVVTYNQGANGGVTKINELLTFDSMVHDSTKCVGQVSPGGTPFFGQGHRIAILGNYINLREYGEHNIRVMYHTRSAVQYNTTSRPSVTKAWVTMRAPDFNKCTKAPKGDGSSAKCYFQHNSASEYGVISDNEGDNTGSTSINFTGAFTTYVDTAVETGTYISRYDYNGAYATHDNRIRHYVIERNFAHHTGVSTQLLAAFSYQGNYGVIRNNVADFRGNTYSVTCVAPGKGNNFDNIFQGSVGTSVTGGHYLSAYHNTCYQPNGTNPATMLLWPSWAGLSSVIFSGNNLMYAPALNAGSTLINSSGGSIPDGSSNTGGTFGDSSRTSVINTNPFNGTPTEGVFDTYVSHCVAPYTAYPCAQGSGPYTIYDALGNLRTTTDAGAIQHQ